MIEIHINAKNKLKKDTICAEIALFVKKIKD